MATMYQTQAVMQDGAVGQVGIYSTNQPFTMRIDDVCEIGKNYVLSFYVRTDTGTGTMTIGQDVFTVNSQWGRQYMRFTALTTYINVLFSKGTYLLCEWKLEEGQLLTEYSMNANDMTNYIKKYGIGNWCYDNNITYIDGGKIYTGTITAKQIDVNDLFAQNINATGTIEGATIKGAEGEFTQGFKVNVPATSFREGNYKTIFQTDEKGLLLGFLEDSTDPNSTIINTLLNGDSLISMTDQMMYLYNSAYIRLSVGEMGGFQIMANQQLAFAITSNEASGFDTPFIEMYGYTIFEEDVEFNDYISFNGKAHVNNHMYMKNNYRIYGTTTDGTLNVPMIYFSSNNRLGIGDNGYGTVIMGSTVRLGSASGTTVTSDRRKKKNIHDISDNYEKLFHSLNPVSYQYKASQSGSANGRKHLGFIAQDVKESLDTLGIDTKDFAGYVDLDMDGKELGLIYTEFIALNTHMIQKQEKEIEELKQEIEEIKKKVTV